MTSSGTASKNARMLEKLYATKASGVKHTIVLRLVEDLGLDGAMQRLEAMGLRANAPATNALPVPAPALDQWPTSSSVGHGAQHLVADAGRRATKVIYHHRTGRVEDATPESEDT